MSLKYPEVLYHYCSTEAALAILSRKTLRLSSLTQSNDSMEGRLLPQVIKHIALKNGVPFDHIGGLSELLAILDSIDALGFCLSTSGDMLSQWRGYAADGTGVCIGFRGDALHTLSTRSGPGLSAERNFVRVLYQEADHIAEIERYYPAIEAAIEEGALKFPMPDVARQFAGLPPIGAGPDVPIVYQEAQWKLFAAIVGVLPRQFVLKPEAFAEEAEWRLVEPYHTGSTMPEGISFRPTRSRVIPFREVDFADLYAIDSVVLGPKHETPEGVIRNVLASFGLENVRVRRSRATYR